MAQTFRKIGNAFKSMNLKGDNNNNNQSSNGKSKAQKQVYANTQIEATAQTQRFLEDVDNAVKCVSGAAVMYKRENRDDDMVDILCDNAVLALNMFAGNCEELHKNKRQNIIDLGTKRAMDKFAALESKNIEVYKLIEPHRKFIIAALAGYKNLRYEEDRVDSSATELFENNVDDINAAFAQVIASNQKYNKRQESYQNPEINQKLRKEHEAQLNEYRDGKNYKNKPQKGNDNFVRPKQSDLYFTKNGKESQFKNEAAAERKEEEARAMEVELNGPTEIAYDILMKQGNYSNAVLLLSSKNTYQYNDSTTLKKPIPCQMIAAPKKNADKFVVIRLAQPYNDCTIDAPKEMLELKEEEIIKYEDKHIKKYNKLGHLSIREQRVDFDSDDIMNGNDDI